MKVEILVSLGISIPTGGGRFVNRPYKCASYGLRRDNEIWISYMFINLEL